MAERLIVSPLMLLHVDDTVGYRLTWHVMMLVTIYLSNFIRLTAQLGISNFIRMNQTLKKIYFF